MDKESNRDVYAGLLSKVKSLGASVKNALMQAQVLTRSIPVILEQPEDIYGAVNTTSYFEVIAENIDSYQWQYKRKTSSTWSNSTLTGNKTKKLPITITPDRTLYEYRCKLTGINDDVIYTNVVNVYVTEG